MYLAVLFCVALIAFLWTSELSQRAKDLDQLIG